MLQTQGWGRGSQPLKTWAWPVGGLGQGSEALQDTAPNCSQDLPLTGLSAWGLKTTTLLTEGTTNCLSLTAGSLWEGPTAAPMDGWAGPLRVAHRQLVAYGRSPVTATCLPRWFAGKQSACQRRRCKRSRFNPWVGRTAPPPKDGMATHSSILAWKIP